MMRNRDSHPRSSPLLERISRCAALAEQFDAGLLEPARLLDEVSALRIAFGLRLGAVRVARRVEDHAEEHRALRRQLDRMTASELRSALAGMLEHLESEERYMFTGE